MKRINPWPLILIEMIPLENDSFRKLFFLWIQKIPSESCSKAKGIGKIWSHNSLGNWINPTLACARRKRLARPWSAKGTRKEEVKKRKEAPKAPFIMVAIIPNQSAHPSIQINHNTQGPWASFSSSSCNLVGGITARSRSGSASFNFQADRSTPESSHSPTKNGANRAGADIEKRRRRRHCKLCEILAWSLSLSLSRSRC